MNNCVQLLICLGALLLFSTLAVESLHLRPGRGRCRRSAPLLGRTVTGAQLLRNQRNVLWLRAPDTPNMLRVTVRADIGSLWVLFCIIYSQCWTVSSDVIVVACGGFVKSDVEINYSLIEVRVQTSRLAAS